MISVHNLSREYRDVKKNCTFPQVILGLDVYSIADLLVACVPVSICRTSFQLGMITAGALTFIVSSRFASHMQRRFHTWISFCYPAMPTLRSLYHLLYEPPIHVYCLGVYNGSEFIVMFQHSTAWILVFCINVYVRLYRMSEWHDVVWIILMLYGTTSKLL